MITTMMNKKRGFIDTISYRVMERPGCQTTFLKQHQLNPSGPINRLEAPVAATRLHYHQENMSVQ